MAKERIPENWRSQETWVEWALRKLKKNAKFLIFIVIISMIVISVSMCVTGGGM